MSAALLAVALVAGGSDAPDWFRAVQYAASHNVLMVAAAGNEFQEGNPVEYPAAALQPPGSKGQGGVGLSDMKYTKEDVSPETMARLAKLRKMVEDGTVVPPTALEAVKDFQPPKL